MSVHSFEVVVQPQDPIRVLVESDQIDIELVKQYIVVCDDPAEDPMNTVTGPAAGAVAAYRVMAAVPTGFQHADRADLTMSGRVFGISTSTAASGQPVTVQLGGLVTNPAWAWTTGRVWLGTDGNMTQVAPTTGFAKVIGTAISATQVVIASSRSVDL